MFVVIGVVIGCLFVWTWVQTAAIERRFPPVGAFFGETGERLHYVDIAGPAGAGKPPVLFVHGASGNLLDQHNAYVKKMNGKARLLFIDRPGLGYSDRRAEEDHTPSGQAARYLRLLDGLGIEKVVLVGHSLGCASVAAFAVHYPERVQGLVFVAPATHPWPGGVSWYYRLASIPVLGHLFTQTIVVPIGSRSMEAGVNNVFSPNPAPPDYARNSAAALFLRPDVFRNNARDVAGLLENVTKLSPRYSEIKKPTVIITGDQDDIVLASIHSAGLKRDIEGSQLIVKPGVGHKPDYVTTDVVIEAIEKVSH